MSELEVTILMPCLNEAATVGTCVRKARDWLKSAGVAGEVLVADNGSVDGSQQIAAEAGARVISVSQRGYGAALLSGIEAARGTYVVMGDADDSYDFTALDPFLAVLRSGADLVMGNRFHGGVAEGAMPWLHRYVGNPALSLIGRIFFRVPVGDMHCGLRAFDRKAIQELGLRSTGMEFASEMIVRARLGGLDIREVPTTLSRDGRDRSPHLRTWHDGWRHLRFLLLFSPLWLFFIPGLVLLLAGLAATAALVVGPVSIGGVTFDVSALVYASAAAIVGFQAITFALFTKIYAVSKGFLPPDDRIDRIGEQFRLERGLLLGVLLLVIGIAAAVWSLWRWRSVGWGDLQAGEQLRVVVPAALGLILGSSTVLASFFLSILGMDKNIDF